MCVCLLCCFFSFATCVDKCSHFLICCCQSSRRLFLLFIVYYYLMNISVKSKIVSIDFSLMLVNFEKIRNVHFSFKNTKAAIKARVNRCFSLNLKLDGETSKLQFPFDKEFVIVLHNGTIAYRVLVFFFFKSFLPIC